MIRIRFLDGFRGLAILLVVLFHAYTRWPMFVPYGNSYSNFIIFKEGFLGVQLFFLISGFVILMTLEKSNSLFIFIKKRWFRLFPTMLIATIFIFLTSRLLPERPNGIPKITSIIPGLFFIEPNWIKDFTNIDFGSLEGAFWSLYVEVKYYFIFGFFYFLIGKNRAIICLFSCYLIWLLSGYLNSIESRILSQTGITYLNNHFSFLLDDLSFQHFGWFSSGSLAYLYFTKKKFIYITLAFLTGVVSILSFGTSSKSTIVVIFLILIIFLSTVVFDFLKKIFANHFFLFFGFISYPLYLIHENTMIALIIKINKIIIIPKLLLPIIPILILTLISYLIAKYIEPYAIKTLRKTQF
jgi:peptidoglycan/LPS O-acetylase OafA/YrhL